MYKTLRDLIFWLTAKDPERAHQAALCFLQCAEHLPPLRRVLRALYAPWDGEAEPVNFCGMRFKHRVGLAPGLDKYGVSPRALEALGFGFIELGGVVRYAQKGNPRTRVFRLVEDKAIVNRYGLNSEGAERMAERLTGVHNTIPRGINVGKSASIDVNDLDAVIEDYLATIEILYDHADYFTINVSSSNTPGLRSLQEKRPLERLVKTIRARLDEKSRELKQRRKILLVKISPDLTREQLDELLTAIETYVDGVVATNTTISREGLIEGHDLQGGLSGKPLHMRAVEVVAYIRAQMPAYPIMGVGGIADEDDVKRMLDAGANAVQILTALVYEGPGLIRRLARAATEWEAGAY
jgi:dihydroorotate dehydrogenase